MVEVMICYMSEMDSFYFGEYVGFGLWYNVVYWGCGCKEVRISMVGFYKFYYYLMGDEWMGDFLIEVKDVDYVFVKIDLMCVFYEKGKYLIYVRMGLDWVVFCLNWLVEWE